MGGVSLDNPRAGIKVCRFTKDASIAQLVEQRIRNAQVKGSSPFAGSNFHRVFA